MPRSTTTALAIAAFVLSLTGLVWTAAEKWGRLNQRVEHLEDVQKYLHGDVKPPGERP